MATHAPIIRRFYDDGSYKPKTFEPVNTLYEVCLYENISIGSTPKYKVRGTSKSRVVFVADMFAESNNLVTLNNFQRLVTTKDTSAYTTPIIINLETGEVIND